MYIFFDVETDGLPKNYKAPMHDIDNWPRVIQLAYQVYDKKRRLVEEFCELIYPKGFKIPIDKFWVENGFSQKRSKEEGIQIEEALESFISAHDKCEVKVAHNLLFDHCVLGAEMLRHNMSCEKRIGSFCTKHEGVDICKIESENVKGKFKWPSLSELHIHLFGKDFDGAHDALADVKALAKCYFEMNK